MPSREPLSPVDAAWLRMDSETNPMVITSMAGLDGPLDAAALDALVARVVAIPRFHRRVVPPRLGVGVASWEDDPRFDPALHVHRVALPRPGDDAALADFVSDRMSAPLDRTRPLWQLDVIEGGTTSIARGDILLARLHHCVGDGVTLVRLLLALAGVDASADVVGLPPEAPVARLRDAIEQAGRGAMALGKLLLLPFDERSPIHGEQSRGKRAAWSRPIPLATLKTIARSVGAKTNDVLLASVSAALREYFARHGDASAAHDGHPVHAIVPVFFQGSAEPGDLGNHFGLVFAALPLDREAPLDRVREVKRRMDAIKRSSEAQVAFAILGAAGIASPSIERLVIDVFSRKGSLMITNVAGPPVPIPIAGRQLESMTVWAPTAGHVALGVSLVSYAGVVRLAIASDARLVPGPESIVRAFEDDVAALAAGASAVAVSPPP